MWSARPADRPAHVIARMRRRARAGLVMEPHERVLGEARLRDGGRAVSTDRALIMVAPEGRLRRLRWTEIADAAWSPDEASTVISLWPEGNDQVARIALLTDRKFASLVADRVAASQLLRRRVQLTETVVATVVATRTPGLGGVDWRVWFDAGHRNDPDVARAARRAVADLRRLAGC
jgi:hypothetical protein